MAVHLSSGSIVDRSTTTSRRNVRTALGQLLLAIGLIIGVVGALFPSTASAITQPGSIPFWTWNAEWTGTYPPSADAGWPAVGANPAVSTRCGIDIAVLVDRSGSIADAGQGTNYKNAVKALIDEFAGTPSKIGVWSFANEASDSDASTYPWMQLADVGGVSGPANVAALKAKVDSIPIVSNYSTNWEEGIRAILQAPVAASPQPDMLIVLTDGQPTVHADDDGSGGTTNNDDMAGGVLSADLVKATGTRILAVGVGPNVDVNGLKAISGNTAFTGGNIASADYLTTSFDDLRTSLKAFATALCGGSVTVTKLASTPQAPDTYTPAAGWTFTGTMTSPPPTPTVTPNDGVTLADGHVNFKWTSATPEGITITESPKAGFTLHDVVCLDNSGAAFPSTPTANGVVLTVGPTDVVNCTFRNRAAAVDLTVTKSDGGISTTPGGTVPYVIGYRNAGTIDATGVVLTETVPANTTFNAAASTAGWSCANGAPAGTTCTFTVGTLPPSGSFTNVTFAVTTVSPLPGDVAQLSNTVSVAGTNENSDVLTNTASDTTPASGVVDLAVTKTDGKTSTVPGDLLSYVVSATAVGNKLATDVVLTETVPANTTFNAGASSAGWSCANGSPAGTTCTLALGTLTPGAAATSKTFAVTVANPLAAGVTQIANTVVISGSNENSGNLANNTASDTDTLSTLVDLTVTKTDGKTSTVPGDTLSYVLGASVVGDQMATDVVLTETVPANTTFNAGASSAGWSCANGSPAGTTCTLALGSLTPGAAAVTKTFAVTVANPLAAGVTQIANTVVISGSNENHNVLTNTASDTDSVTAAPHIAVSKTDGKDATYPGDTLLYTITVANTGNQHATGVQVIETLPANTTFLAADPANAAWTSLGLGLYGQTVNVNVGTPVLLTFKVQVHASVPESADTIFDTVTACLADADQCDTGTDTDELDAAAVLSVTKDDGWLAASPSQVLTYDIDYANTGNRTATDLTLTETVPMYTKGTPATLAAQGWTCDDINLTTPAVLEAGSTCTKDIGDLAGGGDGSAAFTVTVDPTVPADAYTVVNIVGLVDNEVTVDNDDDVDELLADVAITVEKENQGNDDAVETGETIVYLITVTNEGERDAAHVVVYEEVPELTTFAVGAPGNDEWTDLGGGQYSMSGPLAAGESVTITFTVVVDATVPAGAELVHNDVLVCKVLPQQSDVAAAIIEPDPELCEPADDDDDLVAAPDLSVVKSDGGFVADPGDEVTYTITYKNSGDQDATGVVLTETVPVGSTFVGVDAAWSCAAGDPAGTVCTHAVGSLAAGASGSIAFTVKVNATLAAGQVDLDNVVVVADDGKNGADPTPGDNTGLDSTPITLPTEVLPAVIEQQPAVAPTVLSRTGSDSDRMLLLAGVLTILGGLLLLGESVLDQQRRRRVVLRRR